MKSTIIYRNFQSDKVFSWGLFFLPKLHVDNWVHLNSPVYLRMQKSSDVPVPVYRLVLTKTAWKETGIQQILKTVFIVQINFSENFFASDSNSPGRYFQLAWEVISLHFISSNSLNDIMNRFRKNLNSRWVLFSQQFKLEWKFDWEEYQSLPLLQEAILKTKHFSSHLIHSKIEQSFRIPNSINWALDSEKNVI